MTYENHEDSAAAEKDIDARDIATKNNDASERFGEQLRQAVGIHIPDDQDGSGRVRTSENPAGRRTKHNV